MEAVEVGSRVGGGVPADPPHGHGSCSGGEEHSVGDVVGMVTQAGSHFVCSRSLWSSLMIAKNPDVVPTIS